MRQFKFLAILAMAVFIMGTICACGDDDDNDGGSVPAGLIGTWYGSNDAWNFWYSFNSNGTGSGGGHSRHGSEYRCEYTYTCSGNTIKCKGASTYVASDGETEINDNWNTSFTLSGSTLSGGQWKGVTFNKK